MFARTRTSLLVALLTLGAVAHGELRPITGTAPDVPALLDRLVRRAHAVAADTNLPVCVFRKLTIQDTLASDGTAKQSREKVHEVTILRGMTHNRLVAVDGRKLDEAESAALSEKERRWRDTYSANRTNRADTSSGSDRMDQLVNEKLVARFDFTPVGRELIRGRSCLVLDFQPKREDLPDDRLLDRVLNLFTGRVWIDEEESEITRADARTVGALRVWGGILGSLESFELHLDRERSVVGVWFNRHAEIAIRARRLFTPVFVRVREVGSDLRVLMP